jgi:hypothetical protein
VAVEPGSALAGWCGDTGAALTARVNSVHHQGIKSVGRDLVVEARSVPDGVIEAIRYAPDVPGGGSAPFAYGVQWHPEFMQDVVPDGPADADTAGAAPPPLLDPRVVVRPFLAEARRRRQEREARP